MNVSQANKLFAELSKDERLHLDKPQTGCFVRADIICKKLEEMGEKPKIVQTKPQPQMLSSTIAAKDEGAERATPHQVSWRFHVAAAVEVNGETLVLDPAMLSGPETVAGWAKNIRAGEQCLHESDVAVFEGDSAKKILEADWRQSGFLDGEAFFAAQPDRFAGQKIVRFPSGWARNRVRSQMIRQGNQR